MLAQVSPMVMLASISAFGIDQDVSNFTFQCLSLKRNLASSDQVTCVFIDKFKKLPFLIRTNLIWESTDSTLPMYSIDIFMLPVLAIEVQELPNHSLSFVGTG